jgi:uncharacterized protein YraI
MFTKAKKAVKRVAMHIRLFHRSLLTAAILIASTTAANAYIGPGSGLSAIGSLVSVVAAIFLALAGFVWYPLKRLFRRGKTGSTTSAGGAPPSSGAAAE